MMEPSKLSPSGICTVDIVHNTTDTALSSTNNNYHQSLRDSQCQLDASETNNNASANEEQNGINECKNEDGFEADLDYDKDYQTVLRLKQQMERNESNPMRRSRKTIFLSSFSKPNKPKECKLLAFITLLFAVIIIGLVVIYHFHEEEFYYIYRGKNIVVNEKTLDVMFYNAKGEPVLVGHLWRSRPPGKLPYDCSEVDLEGRGLCLLWKRLERLEIREIKENNASCYDVRWIALSSEVTQWDCFEVNDAHWYGGGVGSSMDVDTWPLEKASFSKRPFVSGTVHDVNGFGPVLERYWLSSKGVAIVVGENSSLHVSINSFDSVLNRTDQQLCIYSNKNHQVYSSSFTDASVDYLNYMICITDNVQDAHSISLPMFARKREQGPPMKFFLDPVWSTWSYFKDRYNQSMLERYVTEIDSHGYRHSLLMIDDGWEEHYGDMTFISSKFQTPKQMIRSIQENGFNVSFWCHPQLNTNSRSFQDATFNGYLVEDISGDVPGLTRWWNGPRSTRWSRGVAGVVGMSTNATNWQKDRLSRFKADYNFDSFHFVGGEVLSLPVHPTFDGAFLEPNEYTRRYNAELCATFGDLVSVQSAYKCQHLPLLIRLADASSTWNNSGGIGTIIPTVLTMGLIGYPFFIPDAIGGSAYDEMPSKELYMRWLELSAFLPIIHFSIPPFYYDSEVHTLAKEMLKLHDTIVVPEVSRIMDETVRNLTPIIRPIWWNAPTDEEALKSSTEFLVGDCCLVAPVLRDRARQRDIYLPEGLWEDALDQNVVHSGPTWLHDYSVPLDKVPYFIRR